MSKLEPYFGLLIVILGAIFYLPFLGSVHLFDWDEINFAESSREMLVSGNYFRVTVEFQPFWEKPPFFFWLQAASMKIFGVNEFAARLPNALIGILTLFTIFKSGKRIYNAKFGFIWALVFLVSFLPFFYFKTGIIDPVFNYFIFTSLLLLKRSTEDGSKHPYGWALAAGMLNGMAILTKGPVGLLLVVLTIFILWILSKFKRIISIKSFALFAIGAFIISSLWYLPELINNGPWFMKQFVLYQIELFTKPVAGHQQPFYYHFLVVLIGCFPLSIIALPELFSKSRLNNNLKSYKRWTLVLFWVVMILFTVVNTKIVHYSSMAYLPLSFLAAKSLIERIEANQSIGKFRIIVLGIIGFIFSLFLLIVPFVFIHKAYFLPYFKDSFAVAAIQQDFQWSVFDYVFGILFFLAVVILIWLFLKKRTMQALLFYGILSLTILTFYLKLIVPKVERHLQGELISFYQSMAGQDVYVVPVGFKTYAYLFYFKQPNYPNQPTGVERREWLTRGVIDKPVYIVVKNTEKYVKDLPDVLFYKEAGGYLIYKRSPKD